MLKVRKEFRESMGAFSHGTFVSNRWNLAAVPTVALTTRRFTVVFILYAAVKKIVITYSTRNFSLIFGRG